MTAFRDQEAIETAHKYELRPGSLKCRCFFLFDKGYSRADVRYLVRRFADPSAPERLTNTVRKYYNLWREEKRLEAKLAKMAKRR